MYNNQHQVLHVYDPNSILNVVCIILSTSQSSYTCNISIYPWQYRYWFIRIEHWKSIATENGNYSIRI